MLSSRLTRIVAGAPPHAPPPWGGRGHNPPLSVRNCVNTPLFPFLLPSAGLNANSKYSHRAALRAMENSNKYCRNNSKLTTRPQGGWPGSLESRAVPHLELITSLHIVCAHCTLLKTHRSSINVQCCTILENPAPSWSNHQRANPGGNWLPTQPAFCPILMTNSLARFKWGLYNALYFCTFIEDRCVSSNMTNSGARFKWGHFPSFGHKQTYSSEVSQLPNEDRLLCIGELFTAIHRYPFTRNDRQNV